MPSANPRMLVMGLLSSWLTLATNSLRLSSTCRSWSLMALKVPDSSRSSRSPFVSSTRMLKSPRPMARAAPVSSPRGFIMDRTTRLTAAAPITEVSRAMATTCHSRSSMPLSICWALVWMITAPATDSYRMKGTPTVKAGSVPTVDCRRMDSPASTRFSAAVISSPLRLATKSGSSL